MMSKFKESRNIKTPDLSTSSTSDIVFILLFFFMVTSSMKESMIMVIEKTPEATEVKKLENKSLVSSIHVGVPQPNFQKAFGTMTRIQLNDRFATLEDIRTFIAAERDKLNEVDRNKMTIQLKIDENTKMGVVNDLKQALRQANALKISYSAKKTKAIF